MASDTKNVKVGPCMVFLDGKDLGYTKGGVEVEVTSETYRTEVDQFGKTAISEVIMARNCKIKIPLAETTVQNMAKNFPGSSIETDGVRPAGSIQIGVNPTANQTVIVNGKTFTFKAAAPGMFDVLVGANAAASAKNLWAKLKACTDPAVNVANYGDPGTGTTITVTHDEYTLAANVTFTLAAGTSGATVVQLTGGAVPTYMRVMVTDGVGLNLLNLSGELRLHPQDRPVTDQSDDLVFPRAATAGGIQFAYRLEEERVFNCEFMAYPDPVTRKMYHLGN